MDTFIVKDGDKTREKKKFIAEKIRRLIVEISPHCDHSQENVKNPRFISGIVAPEKLIIKMNDIEKEIKLKKKGGFLYIFGPLYFSNLLKELLVYDIYLSARHFITGDLKEVSKLCCYTRIRKQALNELQSWFYYHASRPGKVILR